MVSLLADTANRLPVQVVMDTLLQAPAAILNNNLAATPLNSQEGTRPRAAATRQHLVSISECKLYIVMLFHFGTWGHAYQAYKLCHVFEIVFVLL